MSYSRHNQLSSLEYVKLIIALGLGTILEWYDFSTYAQLSATITKLFFPPTNPHAATMAFWAVYAAGFVSRPLGAILLGHVGDTMGRKLCLLLSISAMALPTLIIGCLPTYDHIGVAAPILMAILRFIQGLAMGGEFGAAIVYLAEITVPRHKNLAGAYAFACAFLGTAFGVVVVLVVNAALTPEQMSVWGWRLPFLLTVVSAALALLLRMNMPEPQEFLHSRQQLMAEAVAAAEEAATLRLASSSSRSLKPSLRLNPKTWSRSSSGAGATAAAAASEGPLLPLVVEGEDTAVAATEAVAASAVAAKHEAVAAGPGAVAPATATCLVESASVHHEDRGSGARDTKGRATSPSSTAAPAAAAALAAGSSREAAAAAATAKGAHYTPLLVLLRHHWLGMLLQMMFEAWVAAGFFLFTAWVPNFYRTAFAVPTLISNAMLITCVVGGTCTVLIAGWASDKGFHRLRWALGVYALAAALGIPQFQLLSQHRSIGACWGVLGLAMLGVGLMSGLIPGTCTDIYPAAVRTTGFSLPHNIVMSLVGGLAPTAVSALQPVVGLHLAPGVYLTAAGGVSALGSLALLLLRPDLDHPGKHQKTEPNEHAAATATPAAAAGFGQKLEGGAAV